MGSHARRGLAAVREVIGADPDRFTADFYTRLFAMNPGLRDLFPASMAHQRDALFGVLDHVLETIPHTDAHTDLIDMLAQLGRDHRKFGVHPDHYDVFCRALMDEVAAVSAPFFDDEAAAETGQAMLLTTGVMRGAAESAQGPATWTARVMEKYRISRDLAVVRLVADRPLTHTTGQFLELTIPQRPRVWRNYSPAIPPNADHELEFHVRAIPSGTVSSAIVGETEVGDVWTLAQGHGTLSVSPDRDVLMLAGGTGVAPLRSLLLTMARRADTRRTHLFYGARYPGELYDAMTLTRLAATNPWLTVTLVSQERDDPWWLTTGLDPSRLPLEHRIGTPASVAAQFGADTGEWNEHQVLLAGSRSMIETSRRSLILAGVPAHRIQHDPV